MIKYIQSVYLKKANFFFNNYSHIIKNYLIFFNKKTKSAF